MEGEVAAALHGFPLPAISTTTCSMCVSTCDTAQNTVPKLLNHDTSGWDVRSRSEFQAYATTSQHVRVLTGKAQLWEV